MILDDILFVESKTSYYFKRIVQKKMNWVPYLSAFFLLILIDLLWLVPLSSVFSTLVKDIQGHAPNFRLGPAIVVYIALAYLVHRSKTVQDAFFMGAATYAVYDFTNLAIFEKYNLYLAIADTIWGGVLMATVRYLLNQAF